MARPQATRYLPQYPGREAVHHMMDACERERDRLLVELMFRTGGRVSEVLDIRVGDLTRHGLRMRNLKQGFYRTLEDGTKEHVRVAAEKHVFLDGEFLSRLREATAGQPPNTPLVGRLADGKVMSRKRAWEIVKEAAARAGVTIRRFSDGVETAAWPHSLRHASAVVQLEQGVPVNAVQAQLGHSRINSTAIYLQLADPQREAMIEKVKF